MMMSIKWRRRLAAFLVALFTGTSLWDSHALQAHKDDLPIKGAVYHVHAPDGSSRTYLDIYVGDEFTGRLPEDVDSITITGPNGDLPLGKDDFTYNPKLRDFWTALPGTPAIGSYEFKVKTGNSIGTATDVQSSLRTIPIPDASTMRPARREKITCKLPSFSWAAAQESAPLYYLLEIRDEAKNGIYRTEYVKDMLSLRLPPDVLEVGQRYRWRVRAADGPDWITLNNRSQSPWLPFAVAQTQERCEYNYQVPTETDDGWETSSLDAEGFDTGQINALMRRILSGDIPNIHGVLIVKNGKLVLEEYFYGYARPHPHRLMSVSKSITSILIGLALEQNKIIDTDARMTEFFPAYPDVARNVHLQNIRLHHVLTMTAGLDWNTWTYPEGDMRDSTYAMSQSDDWIKFVLEREVADPPGERYVYNNGLTMLLGEILRNATGLYADQFAEKYLFDALGITDFNWHKLPNGIVNTAGGLRLRPRDMAKIGYMMLKGGKWKGKQIVPPIWIKQSTKAHVQEEILLGSGYGYQWWRGRTVSGNKDIEVFFAAGRGGQYIFVCPALDMVTVFTSKFDNDGMGEFRPQIIMVESIIPALLPAPPPRKAVPISSKKVEQIAGDYLSQTMQIPLTIFSEGNNLFFKGPDEEVGQLFASTETRFFGTSERTGTFQADFFSDQKGEMTHFLVQVGFGFWRFDKVK